MKNLVIKHIIKPRSLSEIQELIKLRNQVYGEELNLRYVYNEDPQVDLNSIHILLYKDSKLISGQRILEQKPLLKCGKFFIVKEERNNGYSRIMIDDLIKFGKTKKVEGFNKLQGRAFLENVHLYLKLGFKIDPEILQGEGFSFQYMEMDL